MKKNNIRSLPRWILQLEKLIRLKIDNNSLDFIPAESIKKDQYGYLDIGKIKDYLIQLEIQGEDRLYEAKLLIVGEAGAGKTTLAKKIENPDYELRTDEKSTNGIDIVQWKFNMENGQPFRVNIWDFGGQAIYHATHRFFLSKRSLYTLVADTRKDDTDFYYWLHIVRLFSDNSPLLIIKNEKEDRRSREISESELRKYFANFKETLPTNFATNRGLSEILFKIRHFISTLPHVGQVLPKTWVRVREALESDPRNHISFEEYKKICEQNGFKHPGERLQLLDNLHDLGICLNFQKDPILKKTIILKPEWGTDAVYKLLDNETVIHNLGKFTKEDLAKIWDEDIYSEMQDELLQLMMNFRLCYKIPNSYDTYIVPQLLNLNPPKYKWNEDDNLLLRYKYEFMPKGIITRFTVVMHQLIAQQKAVWKSGLIIIKNHTAAEVIEYYDKREIKIRIVGKNKKDLMTIVTYELDKINDSYHDVKYEKMIPCNCESCKNIQQPHFHQFNKLQEFISNGKGEIQCQNPPYTMVNVRSLIDDIFIEHKPDEEDSPKSQNVTTINISNIGRDVRDGTVISGNQNKSER